MVAESRIATRFDAALRQVYGLRGSMPPSRRSARR